jgi:amidophosphoribosyltransferase
MGGLFGIASTENCAADLFYGTDYHSHLGTRYGGMAVRSSAGLERAIHTIENSYFRTKFEPELPMLHGGSGIGVISDTDPQPIFIRSHLGTFGVVTVGKITNLDRLVNAAFERRRYFSDVGGGSLNPTEVVGALISEERSFEDGIRRAQEAIQGSC